MFNSAYLERKYLLQELITSLACDNYDIAFGGSEAHIIILQYHGVIRSEICLCVRAGFFSEGQHVPRMRVLPM